MDADLKIIEANPELRLKFELEAMERDYRFAQQYIKTGEYEAEHERLRLEVEKLIITYNTTTNSNDFILGRCYSLIKEMYRHQDLIKSYESKEKSLKLYHQRKSTAKVF